MKPAPFKNYGSIGHLEGSRLGPGDHHLDKGQQKILTETARDFRDLIIVQEKLDGANVGIYREEGILIPLTRKGHRACDSPLEQFQLLVKWVALNSHLFEFLKDGERVVGEWLAMAHGTRYEIDFPFVAFDIMKETTRVPYIEFVKRVGTSLPTAKLLHIGCPISIKRVERLLGDRGHHGALETAEGAVWRVEREGAVDFLGKYVRAGKEDGKYFAQDPKDLTWNWRG